MTFDVQVGSHKVSILVQYPDTETLFDAASAYYEEFDRALSAGRPLVRNLPTDATIDVDERIRMRLDCAEALAMRKYFDFLTVQCTCFKHGRRRYYRSIEDLRSRKYDSVAGQVSRALSKMLFDDNIPEELLRK